MALEQNMSLKQIRSFIEDEVKPQIRIEIKPLLYKGQDQGGYFGVTRQVMCFVDFLGALYAGYNGELKYGRMDISNSKKAMQFIHEILGDEIDKKYRENGEELYAMYRHGLVHLYQPKNVVQKNKRVLKWFAYKGRRIKKIVEAGSNKGKLIIRNVRHLGVMQDPRDINIDLLPISIDCLYSDLMKAIDIYFRKIKNNRKCLINWQHTANAIIQAEPI